MWILQPFTLAMPTLLPSPVQYRSTNLMFKLGGPGEISEEEPW
jgi:hypothetical protein